MAALAEADRLLRVGSTKWLALGAVTGLSPHRSTTKVSFGALRMRTFAICYQLSAAA